MNISCKRFLLIACTPVLLLISCGKEQKGAQRSAFSGGTLRINANEDYITLYPPSVKDITSSQIISQIHMGLVKYDSQNLTIESGIATDWDVDNSGTVYTFHLDPKARFHDDDCFPGGTGRRVLAQDFQYTFTRLCTQDTENKNFFGTVDKIVGAKKHYKASAEVSSQGDIEGIKVINDSTLQITIENPYDLFIYCMANPSASVMAKEAIEKYGTLSLVGAGPFCIFNKAEQSESLTLSRFINYFQFDKNDNQLPYLDTVIFSFVSSPRKEIKMFFEDNLDLVMNMSNEYVNEILDEHINEFESNPPRYILTRNESLNRQGEFMMSKANVKNIFQNKMETIDLSLVYVKNDNSKHK